MENNRQHTSYHSLKEDEIAKLLQSDLEKGLPAEEAELRLKKYGPNKITESKKRSPILIFLFQFKSPIVYLLLRQEVLFRDRSASTLQSHLPVQNGRMYVAYYFPFSIKYLHN